MKSGLNILAAYFSIAGVKPVNEDCADAYSPDDAYLLDHKGVVIAVADGVSSAEAGKEASEMCVRNFISDYYTLQLINNIELKNPMVI